jgi:hypothetical protein
MNTAYLVVTVLFAVMVAFSGFLKMRRDARQVKVIREGRPGESHADGSIDGWDWRTMVRGSRHAGAGRAGRTYTSYVVSSISWPSGSCK